MTNIGICFNIFDNAMNHLVFLLQIYSFQINCKSVSKLADLGKELDRFCTTNVQFKMADYSEFNFLDRARTV